jgi:hypothetical protein
MITFKRRNEMYNYYRNFKIVPSEGRFAVMMDSNVVRRWDTEEQAKFYLAELIAEAKRQDRLQFLSQRGF